MHMHLYVVCAQGILLVAWLVQVPLLIVAAYICTLLILLSVLAVLIF
jgi:hypothetical protein